MPSRVTRTVTCVRAYLQRVVHEVRDHLCEPVGIGADEHAGTGPGHRERDAVLLRVRPEPVHGRGGDVGEIHLADRERELSRFEPGEIEQVAHEAFEAPRLGEDDVGRGARVGSGAVGDRLRIAADRGERRAQVVGHRQQELLLEALRPFERRGHRVDRAGEVGELVVTRGNGHSRGQVAGGHSLRGGVGIAQRLDETSAEP